MDPGILPSSAYQCILGIVYLRSTYQGNESLGGIPPTKEMRFLVNGLQTILGF